MSPLQPQTFGQLTAAHLDEVDDSSTRGRLIRATIELFLEGGYEATRVQHIARRASLTTGAIYANFASKEALLSAAIGQASLAALRASLVEVGRGLEAVEILRLLGVEALGAPANDDHTMIMQGLAGATRDAQLHETVVEPIRALSATIQALLVQARNEGAIASDVDLEALGWLALTITLGSFTVKSLHLDSPSVEGVEDVMGRLLAGFSPGDD